MNPEAELLIRVQNGDELALKNLYDLLGSNIHALALNLLKSPQEAEEVVQDTFLKLYESGSFHTPERSPRAYIYTVARNLAKSRLRKRIIRPEKATSHDVHDPNQNLGVSNPVDLTNQLLAEQLLAQLSDEESRLLKQNFYEGYTHAELSEYTGIPLGTLKSKLRRALVKLKDYWETL